MRYNSEERRQSVNENDIETDDILRSITRTTISGDKNDEHSFYKNTIFL